VARAPLTYRRLLGLDRSGGPPVATRRGQPLRPWTLPNAIGFVRLGLIPVLLTFAFAAPDGQSLTAALIFAFVSATDYLDGIVARVTGQYSRLGALLDPLVDRVLIVSGVVVCWSFELLPRWALAVLAAREVFMLVSSELALRRGIDLNVTMLGRWAVWPTMFSLGLAMIDDGWLPEASLFLGLTMTLVATAEYIRYALSQIRQGPSTSA
jgi:CDP-diacylglycerol--glycerol-3-phosphate 3-phosphatidyltransferase